MKRRGGWCCGGGHGAEREGGDSDGGQVHHQIANKCLKYDINSATRGDHDDGLLISSCQHPTFIAGIYKGSNIGVGDLSGGEGIANYRRCSEVRRGMSCGLESLEEREAVCDNSKITEVVKSAKTFSLDVAVDRIGLV